MPLPLVIPLVLAGLQVGKGIADIIKGDKLAKGNQRPFFDIADEYYTNQSLAENAAQSGLSADAKQALTQNAQQGLASSNATALASGQGLNQIGDFFSNYVRQLGNIAITDSQLQNQKQRDLYEINKDLAEQKTTQFLYNEDGTFKDKAQLAAEYGKSGVKGVFDAFDTAGSALINNQIGKLYEDLLTGNTASTATGALGGSMAANATGTIPSITDTVTSKVTPTGTTTMDKTTTNPYGIPQQQTIDPIAVAMQQLMQNSGTSANGILSFDQILKNYMPKTNQFFPYQ